MIPNLRSHLQHGNQSYRHFLVPFTRFLGPILSPSPSYSASLLFTYFFSPHPCHCPTTWVPSPIKCPSAQEGPSAGAQRGPLLKFFIYMLLFFLAFIVNFSQIFSRHPRHICTQITPHRDISQSSLHFKCALLHEKTACLLGSLKDLTGEAFSLQQKKICVIAVLFKRR